MCMKSEKGITTIDITVAIILITLFVAIIATLMYQINANSASTKRKSEATSYAINEIEKIKAQNFDELIDTDEATNQFENVTDELNQATGYAKKITITDYANLPQNADDDTIVAGLVKQVTVEIAYQDGDTTQTVDLTTVVTRSD